MHKFNRLNRLNPGPSPTQHYRDHNTQAVSGTSKWINNKHASTQLCLVDDLLGCSVGLGDPTTTIPFRFSFISFDCSTRAFGIVAGFSVEALEFRLTGNSFPAVKVPGLIVRWFVISCEALASAVFLPVELEPGTLPGDLFWLAKSSSAVSSPTFIKVDACDNLSPSGMMGSRSCGSGE